MRPDPVIEIANRGRGSRDHGVAVSPQGPLPTPGREAILVYQEPEKKGIPMPIAIREASATVTDAFSAHVLDRVAQPLADDLASRSGDESLRILFLVSAHNGLSQRAWIALTDLGHDVAVAVVGSAAAMEAAVREHDPQLIVCPFLKQMITESIWSTRRCLIMHPGPRGDRGPSSLDWAIELDERDWGVTVLQANGEPDAGDVWATRDFPMRRVAKSSLYRHEVRHAAIEALVEAIERIIHRHGRSPQERVSLKQAVKGRARPLMSQTARAIRWDVDRTDTLVRKIRAAEGHPGVLDAINGIRFHLFGAHPERVLRGQAGKVIARQTDAICRATVDGAVWITHLRRQDVGPERYFKLPATRALSLAGIELDVPEIAVPIAPFPPADDTYREITYVEKAGVGYLHFDFYNGAMSTDQCVRLREAYTHARTQRHTKVIVLLGGDDYFSNGIHLSSYGGRGVKANRGRRCWLTTRMVSSAEGAAGLTGARRAVRLIYAGWVPQNRVPS